MAVIPSSSAGPEERLHEILAEYLQAVDAGQQPIRDEFVNRHPDLADELRDFFANQDRADELAGPLRPDAEAHEPTLASDVADAPGPGTTVRYFGDYEPREPMAR